MTLKRQAKKLTGKTFNQGTLSSPPDVASIEQESWLVERLQQRDLGVFEEFYKSHRPRLRSFIFSIVKDEQSADEVFNDTMMTVWNKIEGFGGRSKLSTWTFTIAYRLALRALKKNKKEIPKEEIEVEEYADNSFEQNVSDNKIRDALVKAIEALPEAQSTVVKLAYFHDMGYREVAEVLDCPVDTVKTRMFHARRKLKSVLGGSMSDWA